MATLKRWQETFDVELFLISLEERERELPSGEINLIFDEFEANAIELARESNSKKPMLGANADSNEPELAKLLLQRGYANVFSMIEMTLQLQAQDLVLNTIAVDIEVEPLEFKDAEELWHLNNSVYFEREFTIIEDDRQEFIDDMTSDRSICFVAKKDGEIAGFVWSQFADNPPAIKEVTVLPKFRKMGIARHLLIKVLQELKDRGIDNLWLETNASNIQGARKLYESVGFTELITRNRFRKPISLD